jgi:nitronate monooxygenase
MRTFLTETWKLRVPIIGAPMSPQAGPALACAISRAGGLGMLGVAAAQPVERLLEDAAACTAQGVRFGIGLMSWVVARRPELLEAAISARPFVIALSFGSLAEEGARVRAAGIELAAQVQDLPSALAAERAGATLLVAQGTEAGGHTGTLSTLPLLQLVLDAVRLPVVAAGGIGSGRGLAAVLAAGAAGAWIGTRFLVAEEARHSDRARQRVAASSSSDTVLTSVFDVVQGIPWPAEYRGRALKNSFTEAWHGSEARLASDKGARERFEEARRREDYDTAHIYAGEAVGLANAVQPASAIVDELSLDAEQRLRACCAAQSASG